LLYFDFLGIPADYREVFLASSQVLIKKSGAWPFELINSYKRPGRFLKLLLQYLTLFQQFGQAERETIELRETFKHFIFRFVYKRIILK